MTTLHTPGPWSVEIDHHNNAAEYIRAIADGEMYDLASVLCDETGNATANARLIAAAPELLAALQSVARLLDDPDADHFDADRVQAEVEAAIKLATGGNP